jgi:hypothetical protein
MGLALIVIPNPPALSREHGSDGQQLVHLPGLKDAALRVHEGYTLTVELEPGPEIGGFENPASHSGEAVHMVESSLV